MAKNPEKNEYQRRLLTASRLRVAPFGLRISDDELHVLLHECEAKGILRPVNNPIYVLTEKAKKKVMKCDADFKEEVPRIIDCVFASSGSLVMDKNELLIAVASHLGVVIPRSDKKACFGDLSDMLKIEGTDESKQKTTLIALASHIVEMALEGKHVVRDDGDGIFQLTGTTATANDW